MKTRLPIKPAKSGQWTTNSVNLEPPDLTHAKHSDQAEVPAPPPVSEKLTLLESFHETLKSFHRNPAKGYYLSSAELLVAEDTLMDGICQGSLRRNTRTRMALCHEAVSLALEMATPDALAPWSSGSKGTRAGKSVAAGLTGGKHARILDIERLLSKIESNRGNCGLVSFLMRASALCFQSTYGESGYGKFGDCKSVLKLFSTFLGQCAFDKAFIRRLNPGQREAMAWCFYEWCEESNFHAHWDAMCFQSAVEIAAKQKACYKNLLNIFLNDASALQALCWGGNPRTQMDYSQRRACYYKAGSSLTSMLRRKFLAARAKAGLPVPRKVWFTNPET